MREGAKNGRHTMEEEKKIEREERKKEEEKAGYRGQKEG